MDLPVVEDAVVGLQTVDLLLSVGWANTDGEDGTTEQGVGLTLGVEGDDTRSGGGGALGEGLHS